MTNELWADAEVIHRYTRAQAIEDGVLVDVTTPALEAGFMWPVALTAAAWADAVSWNQDHYVPQDEQGRLWDVLTMARHAIRQRVTGAGDHIEFQVLRVPNTPTGVRADLTTLRILAGPGDTPDPTLTITCPNED